MANIKGVDIVEKSHLDDAIKSGEELFKVYVKLDEQIIKTAKDSKKLAQGFDVKSAKGIQQLNKALTESEQKKKAIIKVDQDREKLEVKLKALNSEKIKQNDILKRQISDQTKANKAWAEGQRKLLGTEERLLAANKRLRAARLKLNTTTKEGTARLNEINAALNKNNAVLLKNSDNLKKQRLNVGNYKDSLRGATNGLKRFAGALGLVGGMALLVKGLKAAFNVIKNFDQATANLSSVLGVSKTAMSALTEQAKLLGATTKFTASQVSELQLEYAKLGFTQKEIEGVTEATLQLAAAAGTDLGNAATIVGSTLRAFNLDVDNTQRLVDVMAKSFSSSSLDIDKFSSAMANVAPAAKAIGLTIEETTALIGTLTDSGIDASSAGTGLRNMFLEAKKQGISFDEALAKIENSTDKLGTSFDIFGKKGSTLGVILAENGDGIASLEEKLLGAGGAAKEMADKQLDTLGGALDILQSAWEGAILKMNEGTGAGEGFKDLILVLADVIPPVVQFIGDMAANIAKLIKQTAGLKTSWTEAFDSLQNFKNALADTLDLLLGWIPGVKEMNELLRDQGDATVELTAKQRRHNVVSEQSIRIGKELLSQNQEEISDIAILIDGLTDENTTREEKNKIIAKLQEDYPDVIANIDLETASTQALIQVKKDLVKALLDEAIERKKAEAQANITGQILDLELQKIGKNASGVSFLNDRIKELTQSLPLIDEIANTVRDNLSGVIDNLNLESPLGGTSEKISELRNEIEGLRKAISLEENAENRAVFQKSLNEKLSQLKKLEQQRVSIIKDGLDEVDQATTDFNESGKGTVKVKVKFVKDSDPLADFDIEDFQNVSEDFGEDATGFQVFGLGEDEDATQAALRDIKLQDDLNKLRIKQQKDFAKQSVDIAKQMIDLRIAELDRLIEKQRTEIAESQTEVSRLQALAAAGNVDAC